MGLKQNSYCYELNVSSLSKNVKESVIEAAILGYDVIAINTILCETEDHKKSKKKPHESKPPLPPPVTASITASDAEKRKIKKSPKLLTRLTIIAPDARDDLEELLATARAQYDIVAVAPGTDAALVQCCKADLDLITFDGSSEIGTLALRHLPAAVQKGIYLELQYDACVGSSSARARQACLRQHQSVSSAVGGRQVVVSSGAVDPSRLRSPADVVHLCCLLGLSSDAAHAALTRACADLLHSCARRRVQLPTSRPPTGPVTLYATKKKKRKVFDHDLANMFLANFSSVKRLKA